MQSTALQESERVCVSCVCECGVRVCVCVCEVRNILHVKKAPSLALIVLMSMPRSQSFLIFPDKFVNENNSQIQ